MRQILLIASASKSRVRQKAEDLVSSDPLVPPAVTVLCGDERAAGCLREEIPKARVISFAPGSARSILKELRRTPFDQVLMFWTGDRGFVRLKLAGLRSCRRLRQIEIDIGDGHSFRLGLRTYLRFLTIRMKFPLPSDHDRFVPEAEETQPAEPPATPGERERTSHLFRAWAARMVHIQREKGPADDAARPAATPDLPVPPSKPPLPPSPPEGEVAPDIWSGDKVLIIQSADPARVMRALDPLVQSGIFRDPRFTLFCRNRPEIVEQFESHPLFYAIRAHNEARDSLRHLADLRRERFHTVVVFFTGDPSYWKIKFLPFFLGARHKLIFNENNDCFFFSLKAWLSLLAHRMSERSLPGAPPRWTTHVRLTALWILKLIVFPVRFAWLLGTWFWLRAAGWRHSN